MLFTYAPHSSFTIIPTKKIKLHVHVYIYIHVHDYVDAIYIEKKGFNIEG